MADVIDDPNDPRLQDTPLNPPEFDPSTYAAKDAPAPVVNQFDPVAYASGKEAVKTAEQPQVSSQDPYKQRLINKITSGVTDLTYGPGSPNPTGADMKEFVGAHDNPLKTGQVALAPSDYYLFSPSEREGLGIADKRGQPHTEGMVERYFGPEVTGSDWRAFVPKDGGGGFNPKAYADGKPGVTVPDIHAYLGPAPANTPEAGTAEEPSTAEKIGGAISKAASKYGETLANRRIPQFATPQSQLTPIPQAAAPQGQVIPGQGMIGAAIPSALPAPPPQAATPLAPIVGGLMDTVRGAMLPFGTKVEDPNAQYPPPGMANALVRMFPEQEQAIQQNIATIQADPTSRQAYNAYGQLAMTIGPFAARGLTEVAGGVKSVPAAGPEVPVPEALQPQPPQPKGLPVKAASVQGLKNPPQAHQQAIAQMKSDVAGLKYQGKHAEAKALQGQINQLEGLDVGPNAGQPPTPPTQPPQGPPPQQPPPGGGVPPQPPKSIPEVLANRVIKDRIAAGKDSVFTRADYDARQKSNGVRQDFGAQTTRSPNLKENVQANKDMEAATFIAEAQGNKIALAHDLELVRNSKNAKLAKKYEPILQYAMDNFDRISQTLDKSRYMKLMADQLAEDQASGITYAEREGYVTHVLKSEPKNAFVSFFTDKMGSGGLSRYFTKNREFGTLAEAINAGVDPASVNLADLAQHRIASSRRLILNKALFNELKNVQDKEGNPVLKGVFRHPDPPHGPIVPKGYELMNLNGVEVAVHPGYSGLFKSLYGDSALRRTAFGRGVMRTAGVAKSYTLAADTYHGFRGIKKGLFYGGKGSRLGFKRGTTVYELSDEGLDTAVKNNEITQKQADWAKSARPAIEEMMKNGLNVSKYADNLVGQMHVNFPGTGRLNDLIFNRVFRGAMIQASHANYLRNLSRFPELTKQEVARRTAKEMNQVFGNMMSQGILKDKTLQDASNLILLSPQWVQSQVAAEFKGYGQLGMIIPDAFKGKFRMGTVAQGQATAVLAYLVGNQIINYATTGHSTFENDGWTNKMSAFLPVGDRGVYLNPFALSAEYVDRFMTIADRQGEHASVASVLREMGESKLTGAAHAVVTFVTQRDWRQRKLEGDWEVAKQMVKDIVPVPIGVKNVGGALVTADPNSPIGFSIEPQYDKITQGVLQAMGERGNLGPIEAQYQGAPVRAPRPRQGAGAASRRGKQSRGVY